MRWLFIILFFISCSIEKPIQAKVIYLTVIKINNGWAVFSDGDGIEVTVEGSYMIGERLPFLLIK